MVHSRIREIRKEKGLTLQEVAEKVGTTAQTIGRLETGTRTLSINWVNKISKALGVDGSALLALPETGDFEIIGELGENGLFAHKSLGTLSPRLFAAQPVAVSVKANTYHFKAGDILVFDQTPVKISSLSGRDCLITLKNEAVLGLFVASKTGEAQTIVAYGDKNRVIEAKHILNAYPLVALVRRFN